VSVTSAISGVSRLLTFLSERSYLNTHVPNKREAEICTFWFSVIVCYLLHNRWSKVKLSAVCDEGGDRCGFIDLDTHRKCVNDSIGWLLYLQWEVSSYTISASTVQSLKDLGWKATSKSWLHKNIHHIYIILITKKMCHIYDCYNTVQDIMHIIVYDVTAKSRMLIGQESPFFSAIVLSILRFTDSDYPFGIFKLFRIRISVWNMKKHFNIVYFLFLLFVLFKHVPYIFSTLIRSRAS
jgi:hypothetical protein